MENAKVTGIYTAGKPGENSSEEPVIVKIAKLGIILSDKDTDLKTKFYCVKAAERMKFITKEEAAQLLLYRTVLENLFEEDDEDAT